MKMKNTTTVNIPPGTDLNNTFSDNGSQSQQTPHENILSQILAEIEPVDFQSKAFPEMADKPDEISKMKPNNRQYTVIVVESTQEVAEANNYRICKNHGFIYLYNGAYWKNIDREHFQKFLGEASEKMGVAKFTARYFEFKEKLFKQFLSSFYLPTPEPPKNVILQNLLNGTIEVTPKGINQRPFNCADFLTYQLPFEYDPEATAPIFQAYLDKVLPDTSLQKILSEYLAYLFIHPLSLKLEKALLLYGTGANGKSVFFEVVNALLGVENVSTYSLQSLTNDNGYFRAKLANKLVNYASEISGNLQTSIFKQLVSGEPVEARLPYGDPFTLSRYAKLIFNCNELPKDVEHTEAYFRRFLIVPFEVTIPEAEQDKELAQKIINNELSGVFNWVLEGLRRLLKQKGFTSSEVVKKQLYQYRKESDSVQMFMEDTNHKASHNEYKSIKDLYLDYRAYCLEDGITPVKKLNFIKRLRSSGIVIEKKNVGNVAFVTKTDQPF